jgi:hypothetical protein
MGPDRQRSTRQLSLQSWVLIYRSPFLESEVVICFQFVSAKFAPSALQQTDAKVSELVADFASFHTTEISVHRNARLT